MAGERQQGSAVMQAMQRDLRAALTPEHQAQFDANAAKLKTRFAQRGNGAARRGPTRGGATA